MPCFNVLSLPGGSPADPLPEACEFLPLLSGSERAIFLDFGVFGPSMGERKCPRVMLSEDHQPLKDKPLWTIVQLAYLSVGQCPEGARCAGVPVAWAVTHSWAHVYWLSSLPASLSHSLKSLDSNLWLRISFGGNSLTWQTHWGRDTEKLPNCHNTPIFFFPK